MIYCGSSYKESHRHKSNAPVMSLSLKGALGLQRHKTKCDADGSDGPGEEVMLLRDMLLRRREKKKTLCRRSITKSKQKEKNK